MESPDGGTQVTCGADEIKPGKRRLSDIRYPLRNRGSMLQFDWNPGFRSAK